MQLGSEQTVHPKQTRVDWDYGVSLLAAKTTWQVSPLRCYTWTLEVDILFFLCDTVRTCKRGLATQFKYKSNTNRQKQKRREHKHTTQSYYPFGSIVCGQPQCTLCSSWRLVIRQIGASGKKNSILTIQKRKMAGLSIVFIGVLKFC